MFTKPQTPGEHFTRYRASKITSGNARKAIHDLTNASPSSRRHVERKRRPRHPPDVSSPAPSTSTIVMIRVGPEKRLFAAHESIINASPYFKTLYQKQPPSIPTAHMNYSGKYFSLPDELPEVLSCILEFLYKGDYSPRLRHNASRQTWELEENQSEKEGDGASPGVTVYHHGAKAIILRDTAIYCAAEKYQLPVLQRLALRKQGLHTGIQCHTILASARYAYENTPDNESKLRAHYLALMMRCRNTFKRSGTMLAEMEKGGKMFFDLFVAMCNYMDGVFPGEASVCPTESVKRYKV